MLSHQDGPSYPIFFFIQEGKDWFQICIDIRATLCISICREVVCDIKLRRCNPAFTLAAYKLLTLSLICLLWVCL